MESENVTEFFYLLEVLCLDLGDRRTCFWQYFLWCRFAKSSWWLMRTEATQLQQMKCSRCLRRLGSTLSQLLHSSSFNWSTCTGKRYVKFSELPQWCHWWLFVASLLEILALPVSSFRVRVIIESTATQQLIHMVSIYVVSMYHREVHVQFPVLSQTCYRGLDKVVLLGETTMLLLIRRFWGNIQFEMILSASLIVTLVRPWSTGYGSCRLQGGYDKDACWCCGRRGNACLAGHGQGSDRNVSFLLIVSWECVSGWTVSWDE